MTRNQGRDSQDKSFPFDLNSGILDAITNPPPGFHSKHTFMESDIAPRLASTNWFANIGHPFKLDMTMDVRQVKHWTEAIRVCKSRDTDDARLEAQNQLTLFLHKHDRDNYRRWNDIVKRHKAAIIEPLIQQKIQPFQEAHHLDIVLVHTVEWDVLGVLMENNYMMSNHHVFFFFELLMVYEAGHFPCGWRGKWPQGELIVY